jgi:hypothetical protein
MHLPAPQLGHILADGEGRIGTCDSKVISVVAALKPLVYTEKSFIELVKR